MENLMTFQRSESTNEVFVYQDGELLMIMTVDTYKKIVEFVANIGNT